MGVLKVELIMMTVSDMWLVVTRVLPGSSQHEIVEACQRMPLVRSVLLASIYDIKGVM